MVGIQLKPDEIEEIKGFLNLEGKNDLLKVYLAMLNIGNGTLGQISSIVGLDYITTSNILENLILRGYVNKIGKIPRYYCLEPFLDGLIQSIDKSSHQAIFALVEKRIEQSNLTLIDNKEMFIDYMKNSIKIQKNEFLSKLNLLEDQDIINQISKLFDETIATLITETHNIIKESENKAKKLLKQLLKKDFRPIIHLIEEMHSQIEKIYNASRTLNIESSEFPSDILYGESAVLSMMKDLILRTKSNLLILMPKPEIQSLILVSEQINSKRIKVTITGDIEKTPNTILRRLTSNSTSRGTLQLRQSKEIDSWAIIKDNEEILFAPDVPLHEMMVGIWLLGSVPGLEQLIYQFSTQIRAIAAKARNFNLK